MHKFRMLLFTALLLLPVPLWGGYNSYNVRVCNRGQLAIDIAAGYQDSIMGFSPYWRINKWYHVNPGNCSIVYSELGSEDHLHLAFAFTDSTGVWGAGRVDPYKTNAAIGNMAIGREDLKPSSQQLCIHPSDRSYNVDGRDPAAGCGGAGMFLLPASIDYATNPDYDLVVPALPTTFNVRFGSGDRAIPTGSGPSQEVSRGPGTVQDFRHLLDDVARGPGAPALRATASDGVLRVCIPSPVLQKQSWADPQTARAQTLKAAIRQFVAAHTFTLASGGSANLRVTEPAGKFAIEEVKDCGSDDYDVFLQPAAVAPPPVVSKREESLQSVRDNMVAYIEASKTGFAAYKKGAGQLSQGYRMWDSSVKPAQANGCWVVQGTTSTTFSCLLSEQADLNDLRSYYTELTKDIAARLPRDWKTQAAPPFGGDLPNQGYQSSSGAHLEVWIARAESGAAYQIHFQLVSAH